jgi:FixJ family two-component response regulator
VDDDAAVRRALSRLLLSAGFSVSAYDSAEAFLARPADGAPDCLVLDVHLGGMSGLALRAELLSRGVTTPVIFITALDDPVTMEAVSRARASACLLKPYEDTALVDSIVRAVAFRAATP